MCMPMMIKWWQFSQMMIALHQLALYLDTNGIKFLFTFFSTQNEIHFFENENINLKKEISFLVFWSWWTIGEHHILYSIQLIFTVWIVIVIQSLLLICRMPPLSFNSSFTRVKIFILYIFSLSIFSTIDLSYLNGWYFRSY